MAVENGPVGYRGPEAGGRAAIGLVRRRRATARRGHIMVSALDGVGTARWPQGGRAMGDMERDEQGVTGC